MLQSRKETANQISSAQNDLKNIKRSIVHANDKIDKLSEISTGSNHKMLKSLGEKFDEKLEPLYERMDQLYETCTSSISTNNG